MMSPGDPANASLLRSGNRAMLRGFKPGQVKVASKEVKTLLGTEVEAGAPAAMGTGCQRFGKDELSYAIVQLVSSEC
jgi:hypothetical protein